MKTTTFIYLIFQALTIHTYFNILEWWSNQYFFHDFVLSSEQGVHVY